MKRPFLMIYRPVETDEDGNSVIMRYKGMFDRYTSLRWQNCYSESGEFELHMPYTPDNLSMFDTFDIVKISRSVKEPYGIVVFVETVTDDRGFTNITVRGRMLSWVLYSRFVMPNNGAQDPVDAYHFSQTGTPYAIMSSIVANCTDGNTFDQEGSRLFLGKTVARENETTGEYNSEEYVSNCDKTVYDAVQELAKEYDVGFYVTVTEENQLRFAVYDYRETDVMFDLAGGNVSAMRVTKSIDNLVTDVSIVNPTGTFAASGNAKDIYRIDRYVYTDEIGWTGNILDTADKKRQFAKTKVTLNKPVYAIDATVMPGRIAYLEDYYIGDVVRVYSAIHQQAVELPITGVTEVWEGFYQIQVQFGEQMQTSYSKLKNNLERRQRG